MEFAENSVFGGSSGCENYGPLRRTRTTNSDESVKYGYKVERVYPHKEVSPTVVGPIVVTLKVFCWKVRYPLKIKHFM